VSLLKKRERRVAKSQRIGGYERISIKSNHALRLSRLCVFALNSVFAVESLHVQNIRAKIGVTVLPLTERTAGSMMSPLRGCPLEDAR
jgi:hypothetical protein